jgi:tRNA (guanine37-N1)-methyltransferase
MRIDIVSAVPEMFTSVLQSSIIDKAQKNGVCEIHLHNLHDYALDRFRHIDDYPFGGGAGMLIKCQPVFDCIEKLKFERKYDEVVFMTPDAKKLDQTLVNQLSLSENLIILAGHYKGIDQRIRDELITREISIGDYVLSGGELPALVLVDAIVRLLPGALGDSQSALDDSFMDGLLEPPQYTRPADFRGLKVPDVLLSGHHKKIEEWQQNMALEKTKKIRPDLLEIENEEE